MASSVRVYLCVQVSPSSRTPVLLHQVPTLPLSELTLTASLTALFLFSIFYW